MESKIYTVYNVYILNKYKFTLCILHPSKKNRRSPCLPPKKKQKENYLVLRCAATKIFAPGSEGLRGWLGGSGWQWDGRKFGEPLDYTLY